MSSPYDAGRDSNAAPGNAFDAATDLDSAPESVFREAFSPITDRLSEEDYRGADEGGVGPATEDGPAPSPDRFTYPSVRGPGGKLAD
jgi:hypothetical protein